MTLQSQRLARFWTDLVGDGTSYPLADNQPLSFEGPKPAARGNVLEPEEASSLITRNPCNKDVLIPYLRGEDLNSLPEQSPTKWVIDFKARTLEEAKAYPVLRNCTGTGQACTRQCQSQSPQGEVVDAWRAKAGNVCRHDQQIIVM
jgi:hypothetical protein